jgi:uncharacterized membrane protein (UPF0127 family)
MHEYVHMNPNFGKHKLIPILLLIPIVVFLVIFFSSKRELEDTPKVASATAEPTPVQSVVVINNISIPVEISDTEEERRQGLSNRPPLEEGKGMLFVFPTENVQGGFWMRDMYFDIDIIWIDDGKILQIHENVPAPATGTPLNELSTYIPDSPHVYDYVLEMNAGSAAQYGFKAGNPVKLPTL